MVPHNTLFFYQVVSSSERQRVDLRPVAAGHAQATFAVVRQDTHRPRTGTFAAWLAEWNGTCGTRTQQRVRKQRRGRLVPPRLRRRIKIHLSVLLHLHRAHTLDHARKTVLHARQVREDCVSHVLRVPEALVPDVEPVGATAIENGCHVSNCGQPAHSTYFFFWGGAD